MTWIGMLPVLLALLGFLFLWAVLTYNGIKTRRDDLSVIEARIQDLKLQRLAFLQKAVELADNYGEQRVVTYFNGLGDTAKVEDLDQIRNDKKLHPEVEMMLNEYVNTELRQAEAEALLIKKKNAYNKLIKEYPTRLLTRPFKFQSVS